MIELNIREVSRLLRAAVADRGEDHVYIKVEDDCGGYSCAYVHGTEMVAEDEDEYGNSNYKEQATGELIPGCIVGHVLLSAGVPPFKFLQLGINRDTGAHEALAALEDVGVLTYSAGAADALENAQAFQDARHSWGEAAVHALGDYDTSDQG